MRKPRDPDWLQQVGITLEEYIDLVNRFPAFHSETDRIERELQGTERVAAYVSAIRWAQDMEANSPRQLCQPSPRESTGGPGSAPNSASTSQRRRSGFWRFSLRYWFVLAIILAILAALLRY